jgi:hypothetical protein
MKVLTVYNSNNPQAVVSAFLSRLKFHDFVLLDVKDAKEEEVSEKLENLSTSVELVIVLGDVVNAGQLKSYNKKSIVVIPDSSGEKKMALLTWEHKLFFKGIQSPLIVTKIAGDKTASSDPVNEQNKKDELYISNAVKYFLRDLTDQDVINNWKRLIGNKKRIPEPDKATYIDQDTALYYEIYKYGKLLTENKKALSE